MSAYHRAKSKLLIIGGVALFLCLLNSQAFAANAYFRGTVIDSVRNKPVAGASVNVSILNGKLKAGTQTKPDGSYYLAITVPAYSTKVTITASKPTYSSSSRTLTIRPKGYYTVSFNIKSQDSPPEGELIGPEGGEIFSSDKKIKILVPPGALSAAARISISKVNKEILSRAAPQGKTLLSAVECRPYGLVFNKPVELAYILDAAEVPGTTVELGLYDNVQDKIISTGITTIVPKDGYTVSFFFNHFSTYAALRNAALGGAPIGGRVKIPLPDMFTGSFSHGIPISVPPGRKGMQPNLALTYHSSGANSAAGVGYSLNPGYIVRSTRLGPPSYNDTQDTFYFVTGSGTTELVNLVDNLYQAKIESAFIKFYKNPDDSWKAVSKDGALIFFGQAADAKEVSTAGTFSWYLTKAVDLNGNYIEYAYFKDQGKCYLARVDYTGNTAGVSPRNRVEFDYEFRQDIPSSYISKSKIATAKRLKEIRALCNGNLTWRYTLEYIYSPDTNRSLLNSFTQYASDGQNLPMQSFTYQAAK